MRLASASALLALTALTALAAPPAAAETVCAPAIDRACVSETVLPGGPADGACVVMGGRDLSATYFCVFVGQDPWHPGSTDICVWYETRIALPPPWGVCLPV